MKKSIALIFILVYIICSMFLGKGNTEEKIGQKFLLFSFSGLLLVVLSFIFLPELLKYSFAATGDPTSNTVTLQLSPTDATSDKYQMYFNAATEYGQFGTVGIKANVKTDNAYGYSLYVRSGTRQAEFLNSRMEYTAVGSVIKTLSDTCVVTSAAGSGWSEMNRYGWSTDWNPATGRGSFNPMSTTDIRLKLSTGATTTDGDNTSVYIGALLDDNVMFGTYSSRLVFTAFPNSLSDIAGNYTLHYDMNGGDANPGAFPDETKPIVYGEKAEFTIPTVAPTRTPFVFLGWDENSGSRSPKYAYSNGSVTPAVFEAVNQASTLYAIWNLHYALSFNVSGGVGNIGTLERDSAENSETFDIPTTIPTKAGFDFKGYANTAGASTADYEYKNNVFTPSTVTLDSNGATKTLYAVWEKRSFYMQEISAEYIQNMTEGAEEKMVDKRDGKEYYVSKLRDGNVWMTQNLDFDLSSNQTLSSEDTDFVEVQGGVVLNGASELIWTPTNTTQTAVGTNWDESGANDNSVDRSYGDPADNVDGKANHAAYGNYYNWYAATAQSISYSSTSNTNGTEAKNSICPRGWKLPGYSDGGSYQELLNESYMISGGGDAEILTEPFYFVRGGIYQSANLSGKGDGGYYWQNRISAADKANYLSFSSSSLNAQAGSNKGRGLNIRCVAGATSVSGGRAGAQGVFETNEGEATFESDNGGAVILAVAAGAVVTATSFVIIVLAKRKKEEEEELNVED